MSKGWSSYETDRLIMESWRRHLNEAPRPPVTLPYGRQEYVPAAQGTRPPRSKAEKQAAGTRAQAPAASPAAPAPQKMELPGPKLAAVDSTEYPDSLLNMLQPLVPQQLNPNQLLTILKFFKVRAKADNMDRLMEVDLSGASRDPRQFSQQTANEFSKLIAQLNIDVKPLLPVFGNWLRSNTLTMPKGQPPGTQQPTPPEPEPPVGEPEPEPPVGEPEPEPPVGEPEPEPPVGEPEPTDPRDDRGKDPMDWMLAMHKQSDYAGASVDQVKGLATAVEKDLTLNERRQPKELENTLSYLADFDVPSLRGAFEAMKKLLTGFLKTTKYQLGPDTAEMLGFGGKPKAKEEPDEETPGPEPGEPGETGEPEPEPGEPEPEPETEVEYDYYLPNDWGTAGNSKRAQEHLFAQWSRAAAKKFPQLKDASIKDMSALRKFKEDLQEFVDVIGPHRNFEMGTDDLAESNRLARNLKKFAAGIPGYVENPDALHGALRKIRPNTGSHRIVQALGGLDPEQARFVATYLIPDIGRRKEEAEPDGERYTKAGQKALGRGTGDEPVVESLLRESEIQRWKALAGIIN